MKGLMIKDLLLTLNNKKTLVIMVFITAILMLSNQGGDYSFIMAYFIILCGMMTLSTISYDDYNHGNTYLMTLPVTRSLYAVEKYVFSFASMLAGAIVIDVVVAIATSLSGRTVNLVEIVTISGANLICLCVVMCVMLPLQLKFGADNGRIIILGFVGVVFVAGIALTQLAKRMNLNLAELMNRIIDQIMAANIATVLLVAVLIVLLILAVSVRISIGIMKKKEL